MPLCRGPSRGPALGGEDDALLHEARQAHAARGGGGGRDAPPTPISPWEGKMQHKLEAKGKLAKEAAQRKTSNLPA